MPATMPAVSGQEVVKIQDRSLTPPPPLLYLSS
jgi:hypothetical protein